MPSAKRSPVWIHPDSAPSFPDPREFEAHGLVAGGGDLSPTRVLAAYRNGIFPWYDELPILWWSPDPRAIIDRESLHISRSLKRALRQTKFRVTVSTNLEGVMDGCGDREEGTWINPDMKAAFLALGRQDHVHSYEVWSDDELVGGLYGVLVGGLFAAESKFHRRTNASKIALVAAVTHLMNQGVHLFDVQFTTEHLRSLGVHEVKRDTYLAQLRTAVTQTTPRPGTDENILPQVLTLLGINP